MIKQKGFTMIIALFTIVVITGLVGAFYLGTKMNKGDSSLRPAISPGQPSFSTEQPTNTVSRQLPPTVIPTADPTADWKIYESPEKTYTFRYPSSSDWNAYSNEAPLGSFVHATCNRCLPENNVDLFQVMPVIYKSIDEYVAKNKIITDSVKIAFNGLEAVKAVIPGGPQAGGSTLEAFVVYKGQGYALSYRYQGLFNKNKLADFPQANPDILSTFRFGE